MVLISLVAFLLLPALLIYSLVKPAKLDIRTKKNPSGKWSRGKFSLGLMAAWVAVIAVGVAITPDQSTTIDIEEAATEAALESDDMVHENGAVEVQASDELKALQDQSIKLTKPVEATAAFKPVDKTFGITPNEFGNRISAVAKEVGLGDIPVGSFNVKKGEVNDVFIEKLSDAIAMTGTVDKNGELKGITFIMGRTENGDTEVINMMMMAGLSARALSPELTKEQTGGTLTETVAEAVKQFAETGDGKASKVVDGIKYGAMANKEIGIWVYLEPA